MVLIQAEILCFYSKHWPTLRCTIQIHLTTPPTSLYFSSAMNSPHAESGNTEVAVNFQLKSAVFTTELLMILF